MRAVQYRGKNMGFLGSLLDLGSRPIPHLISPVTLGKPLDCSVLSSLIYKTGIVIVSNYFTGVL